MAERIPRLLEFATLESRADSRIQELSGGMKRRLVLARALVNDPELVFLDEPTTGLDPQARHQMWERLRMLLRQGKTILLTTHFMDEAERLCDRLKIIDHGRTLDQGSPQELVARHIEPDVVEVYGEGVEAWFEAHGRPLADRAEIHGETAFCYLRDATAAVESLRGFPQLRFMHRRANLEDVFLKLTGREMRE
jgi:lipooligosaccharide transport system ATP-binding protein